ncbi:pantetheine-phosphate adenylyltransferase [Williamwhitmania taraxaci]|uniref:Phosphopantetheine adenylyltransferase n=1 Tax=Williamwhitmania taraxaci TaxID=1640674 RepID=A0A1G6LD60_9BACT|nr:pantetheine-phosphate adenylyltransferase [Williamwhitmania taraxaci]SDC41113.1 Phosphopantetheine adenylyltransferase [Williamwhitmania taraxaci]
MQERVAVFPGSFDPFTVGHESIVLRSLSIFSHVVIAVGYNSSKKSLFPLETRIRMIEKIFEAYPNVTVSSYQGLTVDFCKGINAGYLLRGLRTASDFEFERAIAQVNRMMDENLETVFLLTSPELTPVNSTIVRDILIHGGDANMFIPKSINIADYMNELNRS